MIYQFEYTLEQGLQSKFTIKVRDDGAAVKEMLEKALEEAMGVALKEALNQSNQMQT